MKPNRASTTAYLIAKSTYFVSVDPKLGHLIPHESRQFSRDVIARCARFPRLTLFLLQWHPYRFLIQALEQFLLPGIQLHYALRKKCIDEAVRAALNQNFIRVWVVGAGFDSLAMRLHQEFSTTEFIEIDHPATQDVKRSVCNRSQLPAANLKFLPADLTKQSLLSVLDSVTLKSHQGDVFVFEGVLMYLTADEVRSALRDIARIGSACTRIVFTFMDAGCRQKIKFRNASSFIDRWLKWKREEFRWGISVEELPAFLNELGFSALRIFQAQDLRKEYLGPDLLALPLAEGECICVADRTERPL